MKEENVERPIAAKLPSSITARPDERKVVLFDIDGTLITAVRRPEYRGRMRSMLEEVFGTCGRIAEVDFGGRTDLSIYRDALECEGISLDQIRERLPRMERMMVALVKEMAETGEVYRVLAGVRELLDSLARDPRFVTSLLTGNVEGLAEAKLTTVGIYHYFQSRGAFGSDAEERDHLPAIAAERINGHFGLTLTPERFVIIGDTPRDISCARYFGARVIAVATGVYSPAQLEPHSPDALLADLSDTEAVMRLLAEI